MLTPEALLERRKGIGGSDAAKVVSGDWHSLWLDKTAKREPEDLSRVFAVQLGVVTEELNLRFAGYKMDADITRQGEVVICPKHPLLRCTLDGFANNRVVQAKHVNGFSKIEDVRARYQFQVMHESICCGVKQGVLSVIIGTSEPVLELIDLDDFWANEYIEKCHEFWGYVERNEPPPQGAPVAEPPPPTVMRVVDMTGSNAWASAAADYLSHGPAAKLYETAQKDLKAMVEPNVRQASGHGVTLSRSKSGSLLFKKEK